MGFSILIKVLHFIYNLLISIITCGIFLKKKYLINKIKLTAKRFLDSTQEIGKNHLEQYKFFNEKKVKASTGENSIFKKQRKSCEITIENNNSNIRFEKEIKLKKSNLYLSEIPTEDNNNLVSNPKSNNCFSKEKKITNLPNANFGLAKWKKYNEIIFPKNKNYENIKKILITEHKISEKLAENKNFCNYKKRMNKKRFNPSKLTIIIEDEQYF